MIEPSNRIPRSPRSLMGFTTLLTVVALTTAGCSLTRWIASPTPTPRPTRPAANPLDQTPDAYPVRYYARQPNVSFEPPLEWEMREGKGNPIVVEVSSPDEGVSLALAQTQTPGGRSVAEAGAEVLQAWLGKGELEIQAEDPITFDDGTAGLRRAGRYHPSAATGDALRWELYVLEADGQVYLVALTGKASSLDRYVEVLERAALSLRVEPSEPLGVPHNRALVYASGEPLTLDPALTHYGGGGMIGDLFSGLVVLDPGMQIRPALAEWWEVNQAETTYTFHLNPTARFHNGRPVIAEDVVFSWERAAHPDTGSETVLLYMGDILGIDDYNAGEADHIAGVKVIDKNTLEVTIDAPKPYFLAKLTYPVSWVVDRYNVHMPHWDLHPNGTGPFRHLQHLEDEIFILERNPFYYDKPPRLEYVVYRMYAGYDQRLYENGEIDVTGLTRDQLERAADPNDSLYGSLFAETGLCTSYITFNTTLPPLDDPQIRQALVYAVDRQRYVDAITNGEAVVGRGLLPPGMPGYSDQVQAPAFDPQQARTLLRSSSYADDGSIPRIVWTLPSSGGRTSPAAAMLIDMWEATLGIEVEIEGVDWENYTDQVDAGNYGHLLFEGWCADYVDPENFLDVLFHSGSAQNHAYYKNAAFDALVESAQTEGDVVKRLELYRRAEQLLLDDAPALFLTHSSPSYLVWKPYVHGYQPTPIDVPQNHTLWIER